MAKATTTYNLGTQWQLVASTGQSVLLQPLEGDQVYVAYGPSAPAAASDGHPVQPFETWGDVQTTGHVWCRSVGSISRLIATVGGGASPAGSSATTTWELRETWTEIAAAGTRVRLSCVTGAPTLFCYAASIPSGVAHHKLRPGDEYADESSDEKIWARSESSRYAEPTRLVVTIG